MAVELVALAREIRTQERLTMLKPQRRLRPHPHPNKTAPSPMRTGREGSAMNPTSPFSALSGPFSTTSHTAAPPIRARLVTDRFGRILEACDCCSDLLNLKPRSLQGRSLLLFVAEDRPALMVKINLAARGETVAAQTIMQPRERRRRTAIVRIAALDSGDLEWLIEAPGSDNAASPRRSVRRGIPR